MEFDGNIYKGYIIQGNLLGAMEYIKQFPDRAEWYEQYVERFERERFPSFGDDYLDDIFRIYCKYYKDVFYLEIDEEKAAGTMRERFSELFGMDGVDEEYIAGIFERRGYHFLGGKTSGYFGPYIWKTTETVTYDVELPNGTAQYTVNLLDDFISRSWMDFISLGKTGTSGWTLDDGVINCVRKSYDLESEDFKISLLKHEAQHAVDLARYKDMTSEDLEYRAKLVELIYSSERNLLELFLPQADNSREKNGHSAAAYRIARGFCERLGKNVDELYSLAIPQIQDTARGLFSESEREISEKYSQR